MKRYILSILFLFCTIGVSLGSWGLVDLTDSSFENYTPDKLHIHTDCLNFWTDSLKQVQGKYSDKTVDTIKKTIQYIGELSYRVNLPNALVDINIPLFRTPQGKIVTARGNYLDKNLLFCLGQISGNELVLSKLKKKEIKESASWDFFANPFGILPDGCSGSQEAKAIPHIVKQLACYFKCNFNPQIKRCPLSSIPKDLHLLLRIRAGQEQKELDNK